MRLRIAISTCPNDTFMFDALLHHRIDTKGIEFDLTMCDIEELNQLAATSQVDICKISYGAYPSLIDRYKILNSGSALGHGNGPLLVSRHKIYTDELHDARIAVPGLHTTANMLMGKLFPKATNRQPYLFSDIAEVVMSDECDAGVLIHEERFTYKDKGLRLIADLGNEWEQRSALPLPLGAIVVGRNIDNQTQILIDRLVRESIEYAFNNPQASSEFVHCNAQELDPQVTTQHINLFVNQFSLNLGEMGRKAIYELLSFPEKSDIFVEQKQ